MLLSSQLNIITIEKYYYSDNDVTSVCLTVAIKKYNVDNSCINLQNHHGIYAMAKI